MFRTISKALEIKEHARKSKMCKAKKKYSSFESAQFFAQMTNWRVYHCPYCQEYHITSKKKRK